MFSVLSKTDSQIALTTQGKRETQTGGDGEINGQLDHPSPILGDRRGGGGVGTRSSATGAPRPPSFHFTCLECPLIHKIEFKIHYLHCSLRKIFFSLGSGLFLHYLLISRRLRVQDSRRPFAGTRRRPWYTQPSLHLYIPHHGGVLPRDQGKHLRDGL